MSFTVSTTLERGVVWELTLGLLPKHVRTLLLFGHGGKHRRVSRLAAKKPRPAAGTCDGQRAKGSRFRSTGSAIKLLTEANRDDGPKPTIQSRNDARPDILLQSRRMLDGWPNNFKGKRILGGDQQKQLAAELDRYDLVGRRGTETQATADGAAVGVHHAGVVAEVSPHRRGAFSAEAADDLRCTETLSAGINLPARSVVVPSLLKGPPEKQRLIAPSSAHQIFGRAGRPHFDSQFHVFALAHEDDVKIARWREKYDQIPEDKKDPGLMKAKKQLKKKMHTRRANVQYSTEAHYRKLCAAPPANLHSRGPLPWRLLAYMLDASPEVELIRQLVGKRLMDPKRLEAGQKELDRMLMTLWRAGYVAIEPEPPKEEELAELQSAAKEKQAKEAKRLDFNFGFGEKPAVEEPPKYRPLFAHPTESMSKLLLFRGINPLYAVFLVNQLASPTATSGFRRWRACGNCRVRWGDSSRVRDTTSLPPARWPHCGSIRTCFNSDWPRPRKFRSRRTRTAARPPPHLRRDESECGC